jgi:hypothetical protein
MSSAVTRPVHLRCSTWRSPAALQQLGPHGAAQPQREAVGVAPRPIEPSARPRTAVLVLLKDPSPASTRSRSLSQGLAHATFYRKLYVHLRDEMTQAAQAARRADKGAVAEG